MARYDKATIYQRAINKIGKLSGLVEVITDADGNIKFKSSFDGQIKPNIQSIIGHIESTGINTYRVFGGSNPLGSKKGLDQVASEASIISDRLRNLTAAQEQVLQRLGLNFLVGQDVSISYQKFNYEGKAGKLGQILGSQFVQDAGIMNMTDEGVTVLNYKAGKRLLSGQQTKELKYALGLGTLSEENFVNKIMGGEFKGFGKLPKRIQGLLAERDISLTSQAASDIINDRHVFDDVSAFYRAMLGGRTKQSERFLLTAGLGLDKEAIKQATLTKGGTFDFVAGLEKKFMEISGIQEAEMNKVRNLWSQAETLYKSYSKEDKKNRGILGAFKDVVSGLTSSGTDEERSLALKLQASFDGVERMRDGEFVGNVNMLKNFIDDLQKQKDDFISSSTKLTPDDMKYISELDAQIESLVHMRQMGEEGLESSVARIHGPGMQGKGELFLKKFGWLPDSLREKMLIMPKSAMKNEIEGIPSILLNVAKTHSENIYSDPLMLLYHQDYFGSDEFMRGLEGNVNKQVQGIKDFMSSGALPKEIKEQIFGAIKTETKEDTAVLAKMDAAAKASYLRNRAEAKTIQEMIQAGVDPRQIPALVRRITDYYSTNAFRLKQTQYGSRVDLAMPDAGRYALRTYEGALEAGEGAGLSQSARIDLRMLGQEGRDLGRVLGSKRADLNFVQFRIQGNRMMLSGPNAHLYHHALGTFDLDDKGVPLMTTFKDMNGNDRLAFMTMRQPTGFQEKIFMQGDLTDTSTLRTILQKSSGDFASLLNDADAAASLSNPKEQRVFQLLRSAMNEKGNLDFRGLESEDVEKLIVKLRKDFGSKHGFADLVRITQGDLLEMAATGSSSALGMDKIIRAKTASGVTLKGFRDFLAEQGIKPDEMPSYSKGNFINTIAEEQAKIDERQIVQRFNRLESTSYSSLAEINAYRATLDPNSVEGKAIAARLGGIVQAVGEDLQKASAPSIDDILGLYINRQAAAMSMSSQVDDILGSLKGLDIAGRSIEDFYRANFSVAVIPPSPAVDVSKSLVADLVVQQDRMRQAAVAADELRRTTGVSVDAVEMVLNQISGQKITLGKMGKIAIEQTGQGVGFLRAAQISKGTFSADELIGFDAALFGETPYSRIRKQDTLDMVENVISGAKKYLTQITDTTERSRVQQFIDEMSAASVQEAIGKITLDATSRYAVVGRYSQLAEMSKEMTENTSGYARRMSRMGVDPYEAVMQAKYVNVVDALVESQRGSLEQLASATLRETDQGKFFADFLQVTTSGELYRGLSAMAEADSSINILDAFDTLEATIRTEFDQKTADRVLGSVTDIIGQDDKLMELRNAARSRRINSAVIRSVSDDAYNTVTGIGSRSGFGTLASITTQEAKDYVDDVTRMMMMSGQTASDYFATIGESQDFFDFMRLRSGVVDEVSDEYSSLTDYGRDVYRRVIAEQNIADINGTVASDFVVSGTDIGDDARRIVADAEAGDTVTSVVRNQYRRITDFIKDGSLKELFDDQIIKRSTFAIAGLAAFGFIYSARKDRTQDEITGPPLLPGGSAYETDFPRQLPSISDLKYLNPTTAGMQYKINVHGSQQDIEKMQYLAGGVVDGNVDSTIYNSLPRLGRDPYSQVASRY